MIIFSAGGSLYRGRFRLTGCSLDPESAEFSYMSVGAVVLVPADTICE
jgi:hypothetical protein